MTSSNADRVGTLVALAKSDVRALCWIYNSCNRDDVKKVLEQHLTKEQVDFQLQKLDILCKEFPRVEAD